MEDLPEREDVALPSAERTVSIIMKAINPESPDS